MVPSGISSHLPWQIFLLSITMAFLLSQCLAIVYERTYEGLSYSRSLFQTLALVGIISSMLMFAIGNNLARGIGIAGIFAIIRFRTNLRDPRDIVFVFASLAVGIACGIQVYALAIMGTLIFVLAVLYLKFVPVGSRKYYDGLLRFQMPPIPENTAKIQELLKESCRTFALVTMRDIDQGQRLEYAYQIKLQEASYREALIYMLKEIPEVSAVQLMMQETTVEL